MQEFDCLDTQSIIGFDWDAGNLAKSHEKHGVSPREAEETFFNQPLLVALDEKHSGDEPRCFALGKTDEDRLLFVAFTVRNRKVRVISARDMNRKERKIYEEAA
jgi:Uncharacterized protein conserved in bacteria